MLFRSLREKGFKPGAFAIEFISIIFAVALGTAVATWVDAKRGEAQSRSALEAIALETANNHNAVTQRLGYYQRILASIDSLDMSGELDLGAPSWTLPNWEGAAPPLVSSSSYEAAMGTGTLGRVDFALTNRLATTYAVSSQIQVLNDATFAGYLQENAFTIGAIRRQFSPYREVMMSTLPEYEAALSDLQAASIETARSATQDGPGRGEE